MPEVTGNISQSEAVMEKAAKATCDFYLENTPVDGGMTVQRL